MTEIEMKRAYVADLYPGQRWKEKVQKMSDAQVIAIYLREQEHPHNENDKPKESSNNETLF
jgi:hypothetical protein